MARLASNNEQMLSFDSQPTRSYDHRSERSYHSQTTRTTSDPKPVALTIPMAMMYVINNMIEAKELYWKLSEGQKMLFNNVSQDLYGNSFISLSGNDQKELLKHFLSALIGQNSTNESQPKKHVTIQLPDAFGGSFGRIPDWV